MLSRRNIIFMVTSLLAAATVLYIQSRFEHGDENNALALVRDYRAPNGRALADVLKARHPGKSIGWQTSTQSSCFQHIEVTAVVQDGGRDIGYAFAVDINGPSIHPANAHGMEALKALSQAPTATAGAPGSTASTHLSP